MKSRPPPLCSASSAEFWTELTPDAFSETLVLLLATSSHVLGILLLTRADFTVAQLSLTSAVWLAFCAHSCTSYRGDVRRIQRLTVCADGTVRVDHGEGRQSIARIDAGSVVLAHVAWLRLRDTTGSVVSLFLLGNRQEVGNWRRFQVICRHVGRGS